MASEMLLEAKKGNPNKQITRAVQEIQMQHIKKKMSGLEGKK